MFIRSFIQKKGCGWTKWGGWGVNRYFSQREYQFIREYENLTQNKNDKCQSMLIKVSLLACIIERIFIFLAYLFIEKNS